MASSPAVLIVPPHLGGLGPALASGLRALNAWEAPTTAQLAEVQALVTAGEFALDKALIARLPALKLIACFTSGYDGIDVEWARARGLAVTHAPAVNHEDVADHAIGLILAARRRIVSGDRAVRSGSWRPTGKTLTSSLAGQRLGLVGLGRIGEAVGRRAALMRMTVAWWGPRAKPGPWPRAESLLALAQGSDILVVAARAEAANRGLISRDVIAALGPKGLLVNVARGQLVDEDALIAALTSGELGGAALDVYMEEPTPSARWAEVPNTVLTPHTAGATDASVAEMLRLLNANLAAVLIEGAGPVTPVP
jgi:lactate dehydrogenase-like 2-hydroxyacid dehydrogenase